jgi:hypothetical protein
MATKVIKVERLLRQIYFFVFHKKVIFAVIIGVGIFFVTGFFYKPTSSLHAIPQKVSQLIDLPAQEVSNIATVKDINKLEGQPFFAKAQNGDSVLVYERLQKVVVYRSSTNKIIEVGPLEVLRTSTSPTAAQQKATIDIYNGTTTAGLAKTVEELLKSKRTDIEIGEVGNAAKNDYKKTVIVILNNNFQTLAEEIAEQLDGAVLVEMPYGEKKATGDVVVIIGK